MKTPPSLRSQRDFRRVLASGTRHRTSFGSVVVAAAPSADEPARLGLAVPSRVGGAVVRNRIKRRLRAAFSGASPAPGLEMVIRADAAAAAVPFQEMEETLKRVAVGR